MLVLRRDSYGSPSRAGKMLLELLGRYDTMSSEDERSILPLLRDADPNTGVEFPMSAQMRNGRRIAYQDLLSASYALRFSVRTRSTEYAVSVSNSMMEELLKRGADPNVIYVDPALGISATLLHRILSDATRIEDGNDRHFPSGVFAARRLLWYGADPDIPNALSFTARDIARVDVTCDPELRCVILASDPVSAKVSAKSGIRS